MTTSMVRTLIALPYELARLPWVALDRRASQLLPETSAPRVTLDRALGSTDTLVGSLLGDRDIKQRGAERLRRSGQRGAAARLEDEATRARTQAKQTQEAGTRTAKAQRAAAQEHAASGLAEADRTEAEGKQAVRSAATSTAARRKAAADGKAKRKTAAVAQDTKRAESAAQAKKATAQRKATAKRKAAAEVTQAAATARADAQKLDEVTDDLAQARRDTSQSDTNGAG